MHPSHPIPQHITKKSLFNALFPHDRHGSMISVNCEMDSDEERDRDSTAQPFSDGGVSGLNQLAAHSAAGYADAETLLLQILEDSSTSETDKKSYSLSNIFNIDVEVEAGDSPEPSSPAADSSSPSSRHLDTDDVSAATMAPTIAYHPPNRRASLVMLGMLESAQSS
jgi:hypothetical protein